MDLLQYRKIIIYALTFLAYAWSGYGAGLFSNLRDAVLAAESVFQDLFSNAITVARKIKDIHEVFDAAVEENCVFQCPDGAYVPLFVDLIIALSDYFSNARRHWSISIDSALCFNCTFYTLFLLPFFPQEFNAHLLWFSCIKCGIRQSCELFLFSMLTLNEISSKSADGLRSTWQSQHNESCHPRWLLKVKQRQIMLAIVKWNVVMSMLWLGKFQWCII